MSLRRDCQEIGHGTSRVLESPDQGVLLVESTWLDGVVLTAHNLSDRRVERALGDDLPEEPSHDVVDLTSSRLVDLREPMSLDPFGVRWLRVREPGQISRSSAGHASAAP
jgi:maltose alpha-D-glucosyltransferase / alpha-amylase